MPGEQNSSQKESEGVLIPFSKFTKGGMGLPDFGDLCNNLKFSPTTGQVWLENQRMVMTSISSMADLRRELIDILGLEKARGVFTRMGYSAGYKDAEMAARVRKKGNAFDVLTAGPALHAIEGWTSAEPVTLEIDVGQGHYYGEFIWRNSSEAEIYNVHHGISADPVCWMQIGYATGYGSRFMGKRLLYKEVECSGTGHKHCRIIGKPVEKWDDPGPDIYYMYPEELGDDRDLRPVHHLPRLLNGEIPPSSNLTMFGGMVGASSAFSNCCNRLKKVARTNATVLFLGETGVGKERFARALHAMSARADGPFIAINCSAIPPDLLEAELFGVIRGAFTDATASRAGRFERADGGSIFLDEVGTLSISAQCKLLRVLQEREIERLGDEKTTKVDIRVIAATNADLRDEMANGNFREDLFFRLNVFPIEIPPLRDRRDDIPLLLGYFLKTYNELHSRNILGYTERAIQAVLEYSFPGNIRELENMVERAVILAEEGSALDIPQLLSQGEVISSSSLGVSPDGQLEPIEDWTDSDNQLHSSIAELALSSGKTLMEMESDLVSTAVTQAKGNLSEAARRLGVTRRQLDYKYSKIREK